MNSIVIYYSYGGNTHKSAERIQKYWEQTQQKLRL